MGLHLLSINVFGDFAQKYSSTFFGCRVIVGFLHLHWAPIWTIPFRGHWLLFDRWGLVFGRWVDSKHRQWYSLLACILLLFLLQCYFVLMLVQVNKVDNYLWLDSLQMREVADSLTRR